MATMAKWGKKTFSISSKKVMGITDLETTYALKSDTNTDTKKKKKKNKRGKDLQPISFTVHYVRAAGLKDVRSEVTSWNALIGKTNTLYVYGKRFGASKMMLESASASNIITDNKGIFLEATVTLNFIEVASKKSKSKSKSKNKLSATTKNKLTSTTKREALSAIPTRQDRSKLNPTLPYSRGGRQL